MVNKMHTLQELNKAWISYIEEVDTIILPVGIAFSFVLAYFDIIELPFGVVLTCVLSVTFSVLHHLAIYNLVECPSCGENLSKFKNGKKIPMKQLYSGFAKCLPCKFCGWSASNGS